MCGINGIVVPQGSARRIDRALVERMRDVQRHRGPDGAGLFLEEGVGLGHRRLAIIDVAHGAQPMSSADDRLRIVYNGEVFNHPSLMADLVASGVTYGTHCDTETVLHLYERSGPACVQQFRGMFAIAIWDRAERRLFLARDRFGVKPVYYVHADDGTLFFASEIKALLAAGAVTPLLNHAVIPDFLANHAPSGDETMYAGVRRLPPGHTLTWQDGAVRIERYWDLPETEAGARDDRTEAAMVAEYRERLEEAVRMRLMSDVPLGVFLSGGIDSATIAALMSRMVKEPIQAFAVAFAEREANELEYARLVARTFGCDLHEVLLHPDTFWANLPRLVWHEDEPIAHPSSVALNAVSQLAAERVKVVLTGEGSDETLGGYNKYRATMMNLRYGARWERWSPGPIRDLVKGVIGSASGSSAFARKLGRTFLSHPATLDAIYFRNFAIFSAEQQERLLTATVRGEVRGIDPFAAQHAALARRTKSGLLNALLYADTKTYLHELLMKQDQMSMAASIESRVPFLDHPLVEYATRLPEHMKVRGLETKVVLRRAMTGLLPEVILTRPKMGFPVPVGAWLRGPYRPLLDELVTGPRAAARGLFDAAAVRQLVAEHLAGRANHDQRLWLLLNLELWHRVFIDGEPIEATLGGRDARGRLMRMVWLKSELLHPVERGGRIRTYAMLREIARQHHLAYLCLDDGTGASDAIARASEYSSSVETTPFTTAPRLSPRFFAELGANLFSPLPYALAKYVVPAHREAIVRAAARPDIDVVVADFLFTMVNLPASLPKPVVLFQHNVEAEIWRRHAETATHPVARAYFGSQWKRMLAYERAACRRADLVVAVSEDDAEHFRRAYGVTRVAAVPTGVDARYFAPQPAVTRSASEIVFTGAMDWMPNVEGMRFFVAEAWPRIRTAVPDATLTIVGRSPAPSIQALATPGSGITVTGTVPDVRPYLARAAVVTVPLRVGGGTRLKIYEALGMDCPLVSTHVGAEGLPLEDVSHIRFADSAADLADATIALLRDPDAAGAMGRRAGAYVRENFSWERAAARFVDACASALPAPSAAPSTSSSIVA